MISLLFVVFNCTSNDKKDKDIENLETSETLYIEAMDHFNNEIYDINGMLLFLDPNAVGIL